MQQRTCLAKGIIPRRVVSLCFWVDDTAHNATIAGASGEWRRIRRAAEKRSWEVGGICGGWCSYWNPLRAQRCCAIARTADGGAHGGDEWQLRWEKQELMDGSWGEESKREVGHYNEIASQINSTTFPSFPRRALMGVNTLNTYKASAGGI